jgi:hypothetical protein
MIKFKSGPMDHDRSLQTLNSFLRGELAAVEAYHRALAGLEHPEPRDELSACLASHERRVTRLRRQILDVGGVPAEGSAPSAAFARPAQAGAVAAGDDAISVLEEGEDRVLEQYLDDVCKLDRDSRRIVAREILPEQVRTHDSLSDMKLREVG